MHLMKHNIVVYATVFVGLLATSGCQKFLEEKPLTAVDTKDYYKTLKDVNASMAGIYGSFQQEMTGEGGTKNFTGKYHYWGEGRADNFDFNGQYTSALVRELSINTLTSGNSASDWTGFYRTIGLTNLAIKYIPNAAKLDNAVTPTLRDNFLAQCYAMRAMCYFYIVRLWGDAPIWIEPYEDYMVESKRPRESKEKIMEEIIIPDLKNAYNLIQKNQTSNVWNINEGAIAAILADVYMWKAGMNSDNASYTEAINWFKNVFKAKAPTGKVYTGTTIADLEVAADWRPKLFLDPSKSKESIWSINWDAANNGCACIPISIGSSNNQVRVDSVLHADWKKDKTDMRVTLSIDTLAGLGHYDKVLKYYNVPASGFPSGTNAPKATDYPVYLVMYRLGDVYLSYAEALNRTGDRPNALKYLNFIRQRAGKVALLDADPLIAGVVGLEDEIIRERRLELFGEGKRWFDLVRTRSLNKVLDPVINRRISKIQGAPYTEGFGTNVDEKALWPIHRNNLEDNKKLEQNSFYR
ncbi:RagB/SusD domain protein [Pseudopedobacter saltans DSM 12145]|uniref:RagB/SusD domain protein n=2 Tax=Pseudopedobacter saltans TaxID=151895 RepID=F0SAJ6_PSESL|nr:RagB/SusD domain protein [Pseudopedobacter saltans DSM 12145]